MEPDALLLFHDRALTDERSCPCGWRGALGEVIFLQQTGHDAAFGCPRCRLPLVSVHCLRGPADDALKTRCECCGSPSDGFSADDVPLCATCGEALLTAQREARRG